jgi:uncharacterized ferritin-like protein (DUF455 family)/nitrite reductase/ring-hydroxylating ferredoxin subunit
MERICTVDELREEGKRWLVELITTKIVVLKDQETIRAMEAICPHSGGPLHLGDMEDMGNECVIVCPWHAYRFSLRDGTSLDDPIFNTKTYPVMIKEGIVYLQLDEPVQTITPYIHCSKSTRTSPKQVDDVVVNTMNFSLVDWAVYILNTPDPTLKVSRTHEAAQSWFDGNITVIGTTTAVPDRPARHDALEFVDPTKLKKRGKGGSVQSRIAILHSLANVEQWAIDLAWDIIARYSSTIYTQCGVSHTIPKEFYNDFVRVAAEEATHFTYLVERIGDLGGFYGSLPVHDGLWDSAVMTSSSLESRLAIVHMVHEARGLDVNPMTISKFQRAGDMKSVEYLTKIHKDEITHVAAGQRWFSWVCDVTQREKYSEFHSIVKKLFFGLLKPPFNEKDRLEAGVDEQYYIPLASK